MLVPTFPGFHRAEAQYYAEPDSDDDPDEEAMWADVDPHDAIEPEEEFR
jgi:hypothetical protein